MIKVFVADDEQIVIDSVNFIMEKNFCDAKLVGYAKSGREAIEKVEILKPDLIFMDIRMPGIDGIEAIKKIKGRHQDVIFVIITAYEYFNYAQDALNLGVMEYILKPVNKNKVIEVINKALQVINTKRAAMSRELELNEKLNSIVPYIESEFIYSALFNSRKDHDLKFYEGLFNLQLDFGYVLVCCIPSGLENVNNSISKHKLFDYFQTALKNSSKSLIGPSRLNSICAYIPVGVHSDDYEVKNKSIELAARINKRIKKEVVIPYKIGIGRVYNIDNFIKSYEEAYRALNMAEDEEIIHFSDILVVPSKTDFYPVNKEKKLIDKLIAGDLACALNLFEEIYDWLVLNHHGDYGKIKRRLLELTIVVERTMSYYYNDFNGDSAAVSVLNNNPGEWKPGLINWLTELFEHISSIKKSELHELISKVMSFVQENYDQNISLKDAARHINMSYHYFSKFFKEQTGYNFIDNLTEVRIQKAKEFLRDNTISVKEICYQVGYNDPNYFSKIFKKITGVTPSEFRQNTEN